MQLSWVHTFSPNWVNEARAGYVLNRIDLVSLQPGAPSALTMARPVRFLQWTQYFHENIL